MREAFRFDPRVGAWQRRSGHFSPAAASRRRRFFRRPAAAFSSAALCFGLVVVVAARAAPARASGGWALGSGTAAIPGYGPGVLSYDRGCDGRKEDPAALAKANIHLAAVGGDAGLSCG